MLQPVDRCRHIFQVPEFPLNLEIYTNLKAVSPTKMYQGTERSSVILLSCCRGENDVPDHYPGEVGREKLLLHPLFVTQNIAIMALPSRQKDSLPLDWACHGGD